MKSFFFLIFIFFLSLFYAARGMASPSKITFIFLSEVTKQVLYDSLKGLDEWEFFRPLANGMPKNCLPMGDGCFHPQYGFVPNGEMLKKPILEKKKSSFKLKTINSDQVDLIDCREGRYFDIFCGKSDKKYTQSDLEIWFDVSTSMRRVDYIKKDNDMCQRKRFALKIQKECTKGVQFRTFNTSLKTISGTSGICEYIGLNSVKNLTKWIDSSKVKELIVITDIDELTTGLQSYLDLISANIIGVGTSPFLVHQLLENKLIKKLSKQCR